MRRLTIALALLAATAAIAACSASAAPGWTYAPAPSATPIPAGSASASPGGSASTAPSATAAATASSSAAPSTSAGASPSAGASGGAGATLTVTAATGAATAGFDPTTLETAAKTPFTVVFDNQDTGVPHNLVLKNPDGSKVQVTGDTAIFSGPGQRTYKVPALAVGDYQYVCEVHPTVMIGTLTAK